MEKRIGKIEEYVIEKKNNVYKKGGSKRKPRMSLNEVDNKKKVKMVVDNHEAITQLQEFITSDEINVETHDFLTYEEKQVLGICGRRKDGTKEIKVQIVGPNLQMHKKTLLLKIWRMSSTENYVLTTNWFQFCGGENKNVLKKKQILKFASFDKDGKLCFAVVCVDEPGEHDAT
ncbi:B3 domain-containing protein, DNA-binding pseudobarrel domain protein [Tanacetum coccineum]